MDGYTEREECLRISDIARPNATPRTMDTLKERRNIPVP
jgi:hypothetical protein